MNPLSNHQIAQATHTEYNNKYGNHHTAQETRPGTESIVLQHKVALSMAALALTAVVATLILFIT